MELRRRLGELLDQASAGERILVERDRRPLAVLVPYEDAMRLEDAPEAVVARSLAALDRLEAFAQRTVGDHPDPDGLSAVTILRAERDGGHEAPR